MDHLRPRITLAAALDLPELRRGLPEVVAGAGLLDRDIRWVHAGEVPNIAAMLRGGELLLTTGMGIGPRAADQRRFVAELAARDVAALVIELGITFERLPAALVAAAEHHRLPLVELHAAVRFVSVTEAIHTEIVNHQYALLRQAEELHQRFTEHMLKGGGVPGVLAVLAEVLGNPVFLESHDGRLLASAVPPSSASDDDALAAFRQARGRADVLGITAPVPGDDGQPSARLVALPVDAPLQGFAALALDRAAGVVALALLRARQEDELLALGRGDLLSRLAAGHIDPERAMARARDYGFTGRRSALLPIVVHTVLAPRPASGAAGRGPAPAARWTPALRELERDLGALGVPALVGVEPAQGDLLVVLGLRAPEDRAELAARAAALLHASAARHADAGVVVAAGPAADWDAVGDALRDAMEASAVGAQLPARDWFDATTMPLDRLLWRLRDDTDVRRFAERLLAPVLEHDRRRKHTLMPTLEALCAHGGNKAEAARALHLNRQALYDRIARLQRLLGADLSDAQALLALHLAVQARRHVGDGAPARTAPARS